MSSAPLMSEYPVEKDVVVGQLPVYRIEETEELVVGAPSRRGCFWKRFRCRGRQAHDECQVERKRSCARKLVKFVMASLLILSVAGFFLHKHKMDCLMKQHHVTCVPLEETSAVLPLANLRTHIFAHSSLTGGDVCITHSDDVEEGTVAIKFELPKDFSVVSEDDDETPENYLCYVVGPKFVGAGIHPKGKDVKRVKATSTSITLSSAEAGHSRGINLLPPHPKGRRHGDKFGMGRRIRKAIRKEIKRVSAMIAERKAEEAASE